MLILRASTLFWLALTGVSATTAMAAVGPPGEHQRCFLTDKSRRFAWFPKPLKNLTTVYVPSIQSILGCIPCLRLIRTTSVATNAKRIAPSIQAYRI